MLIPEPPESDGGVANGEFRRRGEVIRVEDMPMPRLKLRPMPEFIGMIDLREEPPDMEVAIVGLDRAGVEKPPIESVEVIDRNERAVAGRPAGE
ncbi:MAG: hypothetical protein NVSMB14_14980 [Isosphaeraceae bacterium]